MKRTALLALSIPLAFVLWQTESRADGLLQTDNGLVQPAHTLVDVKVFEQVATTTAELSFPSGCGPACQFLFPVPETASVVGFSVFRNGAWEDAEMTNEAPPDGSQGYSTPGTSQPDTGSYLGSNGFIITLPESEALIQVRLEYMQILPYDSGEVLYTYPLQAGPLLAETERESFRLTMDLTSLRPLSGFSAPGYASLATIESQTESSVRVTYQAENYVPAGPFQFSYGVVQQGDLYVQLLTHHDSCDEDGYFLLIVEPRQDVDETQAIPKSFSFVMDTSGSMDGFKIVQARDAARFFVNNLNLQDWFNVIAFNDFTDPLFPAPQAVSEPSRSQALGFIDQQYANGSTALHDALLTALSSPLQQEFARILVLLTDGQPTAGETDPLTIVQSVTQANTSQARIFPFGIGVDVNRPLLMALAESNRGQAYFLSENEDIAKVLSDFYEKVDRPVLTDVSLGYGGVPVHSIYPEGLTDLFAGSQLLVIGRYSGGGSTTGTLQGSVMGSLQTYSYPLEFSECAEGANPFLPCLWAKAKIDSLVAEIGRTGEDGGRIETIQALAQECGLQTPYTSYGMDPSTSYPLPDSSGDPTSYRSGELELTCQMTSRRGAFSMAPLGFLAALAGLWMARRGRRQ